MNCTKCGNTILEDATFCTECGEAVSVAQTQAPVQESTPASEATQTAPVYAPSPTSIHNYNSQTEITEDQLPDRFKPMGAWSYFGHQLLFSLPVAGLILLIVFAAGGTKNINKRNFARSYFCSLLIGAIIGIIVLVLALIFGVGATQSIADTMYYY